MSWDQKVHFLELLLLQMLLFLCAISSPPCKTGTLTIVNLMLWVCAHHLCVGRPRDPTQGLNLVIPSVVNTRNAQTDFKIIHMQFKCIYIPL